MSHKKLILFGAGGHAHSCIDVIEQQAGYKIAGLVGTQDDRNAIHLGYSVIGTDDELHRLASEYHYALIALGQIRTSENRIKLYNKLVFHGFKLPTIISPYAHVSRHATIGEGCIVMHGAFVNAGATVGNNCIINTKALIEHDVTVGDHCHISTGAILNGNATVGSGSFIGSGCVIKEGVSIGKGCLIAMGLTVRHSLSDQIHFTSQYKA